jgi:hypothetical protein
MTEKLLESIENDEISQLEIIELIETYQKLVNLDVLEVETFQNLLDKLGVSNPEPNKFVLDEDCTYELQ